MTAADVLSTLYAASGLAGCLCYGPQLWTLARSAPARRSASLASWAGWFAIGCVTVAYAAVVVGQPEMLLVVGLNTACQLVVVAMLGGQRIADRGNRNPRPVVRRTWMGFGTAWWWEPGRRG